MFAQLSIKQDNRSGFLRALDRIREPRVTDERVILSGALPFHIVKTRMYREEIPWLYVEQAAGMRCGCMLLPEGITPDEDSIITPFVPKALPKRLLANSAVTAIKKLRLRPSDVCLTVYDDGTISDIIPKYVMLAGSIRVITDKPELYGELSEELMHSHGFSLVVGSSEDAATLDSTVIISPEYRKSLEGYRGVLFTCDRAAPLGATVMRGRGIKLGEKLSELVAEGVDKVSFASALYEKCGLTRLGDMGYEYIGAWIV